MMYKLLAATAAVAFMGGLAPPASATLMISANVNGTTFTCADQQASCDTNPTLGQLGVADQTIAGVQFLGSSNTQVVGTTNSLNSSSFQLINNNPGMISIQLAVSGTNYQGPVTSFSSSGSGTFQSAVGSTIALSYLADPTNQQGADTPTDLPGTLLATDTKTATLPTDSFAFNHSGAFVASGPYSMSLGTTLISLAPGGSVVGRNQAIVTQQTAVVPEPGSLALLGAGLIGTGFALRRRRQKEGKDFAAA